MEIELEINDFVWLRGEGRVSVFWKVVHERKKELERKYQIERGGY